MHSPLVGPDTWVPVAAELRARGHTVDVPELHDDGVTPFWRAHVDAVVEAVPVGDVVVAGHSGAGPLLDLVAAALIARGHRIGALLFIDAGPPADGASRLDQLRTEAPALADDLERRFTGGPDFPDWTDEQLAPLVPDGDRRAALLAGLRPRPEPFWTEAIPPAAPRPDVARGVLTFGSGYERTVTVARRDGWAISGLPDTAHFHPLVDPAEVADAIVALASDAIRERDG